MWPDQVSNLGPLAYESYASVHACIYKLEWRCTIDLLAPPAISRMRVVGITFGEFSQSSR